MRKDTWKWRAEGPVEVVGPFAGLSAEPLAVVGALGAAVAFVAAAVDDAPLTLVDAIPALLAFSAGLRVDQLGDDSVDQLVDGASSRRNQVLMDLGRELGIGAVDGVHEVPRSELVARVGDHVRGHRHPGPCLTTTTTHQLGPVHRPDPPSKSVDLAPAEVVYSKNLFFAAVVGPPPEVRMKKTPQTPRLLLGISLLALAASSFYWTGCGTDTQNTVSGPQPIDRIPVNLTIDKKPM